MVQPVATCDCGNHIEPEEVPIWNDIGIPFEGTIIIGGVNMVTIPNTCQQCKIDICDGVKGAITRAKNDAYDAGYKDGYEQAKRDGV